ncbi:acyltransferase [Synechococcus sp. Cruz-9H2]|uniref:acyltransferase family protein n=1 Tax=unclassified Synechococcus TaxID=2626047 RepID=UPI0020CFB6D4|nr:MULTISPECIES: acyltransferase family protein [unclassified Synechococcus]MCP9820860.1 acyltransferase [Synechococcus sp. Cruz-9H2]MCP9845068.1 acyltransferase [Synechococcus sp. Edmonson 11F2]MCP9857216.1 acyltransferase [Synechococcus sp. Cruz-9C9]MCP9864501.1 acyltransferase [Synechococcus sp. Cruz-7E5]MCP9871770.1 acyltransferase [Synechococcus sp. Cruz-7B9]
MPHPAQQTDQTSPGKGSSFYRPEIDGLRAVAVIAVIANHFNKDILPSGYLGVDIFFVISGFVITASFARIRPVSNNKELLLEFYARRIKRLLPALVVCVAITSLFISLFDRHSGVTLATGISALFGFSNIYLFQQSTDYFARTTELNAFTHTWSLGIEEQFYLVFPILILISGFITSTSARCNKLIWLVGIPSVASLIAFIRLSDTNPSAAYFLMPSRFWEIGAGCLLFLMLTAGRGRGFAERLSPLVVLALLIASFLLPQRLQVIATLSVVVLTAALIACLQPKSLAKSWLSNPAVVGIGLLSYSLYLWHWSVLAISRWTIGIQWWTIPLQIAVIWLLAIASYRYIEQPLRYAQWSGLSWRTIALGLIGAVSTSLPLWALSSPLKGSLYLGDRSMMDGVRDGGPLKIKGSKINPPNCASRKNDKTILSSKESFNEYATLCTARHPINQGGAVRTNDKRHIFVVGDSHAMAFSPLANRLFKRGHASITLFGRPGCPFPDTDYGNTREGCSRFLELSEEFILSQARPGDVVVINGYLLSHLGDRENLKDTRDQFRGLDGQTLTTGEEKSASYLRAINAFGEAASARGVRTILIGATPRNLDYDICFQEWFSLQAVTQCEQEVGREVANAKRMNSLLREGLVAQVELFDPMPVLCSDGCSNAMVTQMLRDTDHLSAQAMLTLYEAFESLLANPRLTSSNLNSAGQHR